MCRRSSGTARSARPRSPSRPPTTATATSPTTSWRRTCTSSRWSTSTGTFRALRARQKEQAIVGLGGQAFIARRSQDAVRDFRPYFEGTRSSGGLAGRLHDAHPAVRRQPAGGHRQDPDLPEGFGDYQRQLLPDGPRGLPVEMALEQVELLGDGSRTGAAQGDRRPARPRASGRPRPTPAWSRAKYGEADPRQPRPNPNRGDNLTGASPYQDSAPEFQAESPDL